MNKFLVLLYFSLILSYSFCADCECDSSKNEGEDKDNYICVTTGEGACDWVLLCQHAQKTDSNGETFKCSDYTVTEENKETHYCGEDGETACKEIPYCAENTEGDCTTFKVVPSKSETHVCVAAETTTEEGEEGDAEGAGTNTPHCQEKYLCESVPITEGEECSKFIISEENKYTHSCVALDGGDHKCIEEKYKCKDLPKISGETDIKCSDFEVDSDKKETHYCKEDTTSETNQCKEEYLCSNVPTPEGGTTINCGDYPVSETNKYTHECKPIEGTESQYACKESKYKCSDVPRPQDETQIQCSDFDDEDHFCIPGTETPCQEIKKCNKVIASDLSTQPDCSKYPVSNEEKYVCKRHPTEDRCEEIYKCEEVPKNAEGECSTFEKSDDDHVCIEDEESSDKKCKLISLCTKAQKEGTPEDFDCSIFPTISNLKVCIESKEAGKFCDEIYECENVPKAEASDCTIYPVSEKNKKTHTCKPLSGSDGDKGCFEEEITCSTAEKGETDEQCSFYKVSDPAEFKCIKTPSTESSCMEKELSECEKKTSEATDDICNTLAVEKTGEEKCIKEGDKCILLTYCDFGAGSSDDDCRKYALKDTDKNICKKKASENKCEEVEKPKEPEEPVEEEETPEKNKEGEETTEKDKEGEKTTEKDKEGEQTTDNGGNNKDDKDTSEDKESTNGNKSNNSGKLINLTFCLLLINYLVLLF